MNQLLGIDNNLSSPHLPPEHPLFQVLGPMLGMRGADLQQNAVAHICWGPERYGLQKSRAFRNLSSTSKEDVLLRLTELNLSLSYFIEKSGHNYASKMILSSQTCEEKTFYALVASEEATHLRLFMNSMWFQPTIKTHFHPLLPILSEAIQWGTQDCLVFVIQVLLEGFGLFHYTALAETCLDTNLKTNFQSILRDEAKHHGAGLILTKAGVKSRESTEQIFELSRKFIRALESAHWIPSAFEATGHSLSSHERESLFEELDFKSTLENRMHRLREMFHKVNYQDIFNRLEDDGVFQVSSISSAKG